MPTIANLRKWKNGEVFNARDYVYERDLLIGQVNRLTQLIEGGVDNPVDITVNSITLDGHLIDFDDVDGALQVALNDEVTLQIGQEQLFYGKAYQSDITNGAPVMFAGVEGNHFRLQVATPEALNAKPELFIGIATQNIAAGEFGYVNEFGFVRQVNIPASDYEVGDILWFDSEGTGIGDGWTTTKPNRGYAQIRMAVVVKVNQNVNQTYTGTIFVRPSILEGTGGIQTFLQNTEPEVFLDGDLWFDTSPEGE